jgi:phosphocarrier protein HPr
MSEANGQINGKLSRNVMIVNEKGLHARASAKFVTFVSRLPDGVHVEVEKDGHMVTGTSIMGLMMLGAAKGSKITVHVSGEQADMALEKLIGLVVDGFGED